MPTGNGSLVEPLSAAQRDAQRIAMIQAINASTFALERLIPRDTERERETAQLRRDLNALALQHAALLAIVQRMQQPWYRRWFWR